MKTISRGAVLLFCLLALCPACSQALRKPADAARAPAREWPERDLVFRQKVRIFAPGAQLPSPVDGIVRLSGASSGRREGEARVVAIGGIGLTLFDITVSAGGYKIQSVLPALAGTRAAGEAALCVRAIWLDALSLAPPTPEQGVIRESRHGNDLEYEFSGGRLVAARSLGPGERWTLSFAGGAERPEDGSGVSGRFSRPVQVRAWPEKILFKNLDTGLTVDISLLRVEGGGEAREGN